MGDKRQWVGDKRQWVGDKRQWVGDCEDAQRMRTDELQLQRPVAGFYQGDCESCDFRLAESL